MATLPQYLNQLLRRQAALSDDLGVNILAADRQTYCIDIELLLLIAVVMKTMEDKGLITAAEWTTKLNAALDDPFPAWIKEQKPPP